MRKIFSIIVPLLMLVSCEDQVKFNNPAIQGLKDNVLWRSTSFNAVQASDGSLKIQAYQKNDILTLKIQDTEVKTYPLGEDDVNKTTLLVKEGDIITVFSTGENKGDGQIVITEMDAVNHTITGEFMFNAENESIDPLAKSNVSFKKGIFYKVPITIDTKLPN